MLLAHLKPVGSSLINDVDIVDVGEKKTLHLFVHLDILNQRFVLLLEPLRS